MPRCRTAINDVSGRPHPLLISLNAYVGFVQSAAPRLYGPVQTSEGQPLYVKSNSGEPTPVRTMPGGRGENTIT